MAVSTPIVPDFTADSATVYKTKIDDNANVDKRVSWAFAPHQQTVADMTVRLEAGQLFDGTDLVEVAAQTTVAVVAPTVARIDRVVIDSITGAVSIITGTDQASPPVPALTSGVFPICQISLLVSQTSIVNADITDERASIPGPVHTNNSNSILSHEFYL